MSSRAWALLRDARYAFPQALGSRMPAPDPRALARRGGLVTLGHFPPPGATPGEIAAANLAAIAALPPGACLAVKAPALGFDAAALDPIGRAAQTQGIALVFDAHAPAQAEPTFAAMARLQALDPATGCALPARWARSRGDAARLRDTPARIRLVKGEWADDGAGGEVGDPAEAYLDLAARLAGRQATVGVATHDPALAARALALLLDAGTPCELEQLRGLPSHRTRAVAKALGVPVRTYLPFGPGWWPYAIDKALARPYLPLWLLCDRFGSAPVPAFDA